MNALGLVYLNISYEQFTLKYGIIQLKGCSQIAYINMTRQTPTNHLFPKNSKDNNSSSELILLLDESSLKVCPVVGVLAELDGG